MKVHTAEAGCVSITLEHEPDRQEAVGLINAALAEKGVMPWPGAEISLFCGKQEYLLLATPSYSGSVRISGHVIEYLYSRFAGSGE